MLAHFYYVYITIDWEKRRVTMNRTANEALYQLLPIIESDVGYEEDDLELELKELSRVPLGHGRFYMRASSDGFHIEVRKIPFGNPLDEKYIV